MDGLELGAQRSAVVVDPQCDGELKLGGPPEVHPPVLRPSPIAKHRIAECRLFLAGLLELRLQLRRVDQARELVPLKLLMDDGEVSRSKLNGLALRVKHLLAEDPAIGLSCPALALLAIHRPDLDLVCAPPHLPAADLRNPRIRDGGMEFAGDFL